MFRRNVDQYFHVGRTINPLRESLSNTPVRVIKFWLSFCVDPLPVAGQVTLLLESLARLLGFLEDFYLCIGDFVNKNCG
jgi:hypothetical protein